MGTTIIIDLTLTRYLSQNDQSKCFRWCLFRNTRKTKSRCLFSSQKLIEIIYQRVISWVPGTSLLNRKFSNESDLLNLLQTSIAQNMISNGNIGSRNLNLKTLSILRLT